MKILMIEDSRIVQTGIKRALAKAGHDVTLAGDGPEGIDVAQQLTPDLILLDMMLPTMTGPVVLEALKTRSTTKDIPVFVLSGLSQRNADKLLRAGATKYFEKSDLLVNQQFSPLIDAINDMHAQAP
ncbi:MAG TPA: response regulator [Terriglobales bacterium]|nr:response regulator [Terriglobales bacterium]